VSNFWKDAVSRHDHTVVLSLLAAGLRLDDARDVAQETWLRLMEAHAAGRLARVELPGLAIRQAAFIVADRSRAGRLRVQAELTEAHELASPSRADQPSLAQDLLQGVEAGLAVSTVRERGVFRSVLESPDAPHRELAEREGLSVQRFRQVLCNVRAKLRAALSGDES
jgi:DNA-directed RNA polymerase specialized sigma24 family protein